MSDRSGPSTRMKSADRREAILIAATAAFGANGYSGTRTDDIARAAEVSQPYVVRMFVTKERLFSEVLDRSLGILLAEFRRVLATSAPEDLSKNLGVAYVELVAQRGLLMCLGHSFLMGGQPEIGAAARRNFVTVWRFLRDEAGFSAEDSRRFLGNGLLINTMVGLRLTEAYGRDREVTELLAAALPNKVEVLLEKGPRAGDPW